MQNVIPQSVHYYSDQGVGRVARDLPAILLFLSGFATLFAFLPNLTPLLPAWIKNVSQDFGPFLFVATLVWSVRAGADRLRILGRSYQTLEKKLDVIESRMQRFGEEEYHGHAIQRLQDLCDVARPAGPVKALSSAFLCLASGTIPALAADVQGYNEARRSCLVVRETNVISNVLSQLPSELPESTVWLGTSKFGDGWKRRAVVDPSFKLFMDGLHDRAKRNEIRIFRVYCGHEEGRERVVDEAKQYRGSGIELRFLRDDAERTPDISIVYQMKTRRAFGECRVPEDAIRDGVPLYAIQFDVDYGVLLRSMVFFTPKDDLFQSMVDRFKLAWSDAPQI